MLRITVVSQSPQEAVLKVEGWLWGSDVGLLASEGTRWLREAERLVLDLTGVQFIDDAGIALLKRWPPDRLALRTGAPFIRALLETHGLI